MAATALIRLGKLTGKTDYLEAARRTLLAGLPVMQRSPTAAGQLLIALDMWLGPMQELVLIGGQNESEDRQLLDEIRQHYLPNCVLAYRPTAANPQSAIRISQSLEPLFAGRTAIENQPTLYICQNFACQTPVVGSAAIRQALAKLGALG